MSRTIRLKSRPGNRDSRFPVAVASTACAARTKRAGSFSSTAPAFTSDFTDSSSTTSNKAVAQSGLLKVHCRCRCTSLEGRYAHRRRRLRLEGRRVSWRRAEVSARRHRGPLFLPSLTSRARRHLTWCCFERVDLAAPSQADTEASRPRRRTDSLDTPHGAPSRLPAEASERSVPAQPAPARQARSRR